MILRWRVYLFDFEYLIWMVTISFFFIYIYIYICRDKGPKSYIGPWVLSEDVKWFEEGQIVIRGSNLKSHEKGMNGRWSEEELLLRYDECSSSMYSNN